jgi:sarcosine oxidase delta subunit
MKSKYLEILKNLEKKECIPCFENIISKGNKKRAIKIANYLKNRENRLETSCPYCNEQAAKKDIFSYVYEKPYDKETTEYHFCSEECRDNFEEDYFYCESCGRYIRDSNGYLNHFISYKNNYICLDCFQKEMFRNGLDIDEIKDYKGIKSNLIGSFFSNLELEKHGFEKYQDCFISDTLDAKEINKKIIYLYNNENKISIINYCDLSIIGNEGYIEIWVKNKE